MTKQELIEKCKAKYRNGSNIEKLPYSEETEEKKLRLPRKLKKRIKIVILGKYRKSKWFYRVDKKYMNVLIMAVKHNRSKQNRTTKYKKL